MQTQHSVRQFILFRTIAVILATIFCISLANAEVVYTCKLGVDFYPTGGNPIQVGATPKSACDSAIDLYPEQLPRNRIENVACFPQNGVWVYGVTLETNEAVCGATTIANAGNYWGACNIRYTFSSTCPGSASYSGSAEYYSGSVYYHVINQLVLTLTSAPNQTPPDPRPKGTEGKDPKSSTHELIAKVTENGNPKAGVAVTFGVEVEANSGGHDHHDASRPKGEVKANSLTTDTKGEIKVTFEASEFAGTHVVAAACSSCTNTSVTKNIDVKVPDLIPMQADSSVPPRYELAGNTSPVGVKHKGNHYFTASAKAYLLNLIDHYNSFAWQPVAVNDASIIWGGWFDIYSNWAGSHAEHRIGEEVDLGFLVGTNASKIKRGYDEVCKDKKVEIPSTILWHDIPKPAGKYDPHFHVRLSGSYTKGPSAGKYAPCKSDSGTK